MRSLSFSFCPISSLTPASDAPQIIRGGENIASGQIENALYTDSRVKDAAVVPVPDPKLSELVSAVVVLHPQHRGKVSEKELMEHVGKLLPKHCVPVLIVFKEEMPR